MDFHTCQSRSASLCCQRGLGEWPIQARSWLEWGIQDRSYGTRRENNSQFPTQQKPRCVGHLSDALTWCVGAPRGSKGGISLEEQISRHDFENGNRGRCPHLEKRKMWDTPK